MESKRIVIADDESNICHLVKLHLETEGYQVFAAKDGRQALEEIERKKPDLVILDITMPELDGPDVAAAMKNRVSTRSIPIIFLSSLVQKDDRPPTDLTEYHFIAKPFEREELLAAVRQALVSSKGRVGDHNS